MCFLFVKHAGFRRNLRIFTKKYGKYGSIQTTNLGVAVRTCIQQYSRGMIGVETADEFDSAGNLIAVVLHVSWSATQNTRSTQQFLNHKTYRHLDHSTFWPIGIESI